MESSVSGHDVARLNGAAPRTSRGASPAGRTVRAHIAVFALAATLAACTHQPATPPAAAAQHRAARVASGRSLVLYDDAGPYAWLGELYASGTAALVSHFGAWSAMPVSKYERGTLGGYDAAVYIGSTFDEPIPDAFLDDVLADTTNVIWIGENVWKLGRRGVDFATRFGFLPNVFDTRPIHAVTYKGARLARRADGTDGVMGYHSVDPSKTQVLAWGEHDDGTKVPWALRTGRLTYVGEQPLAYVTPGDRSLVLADILFDALAPNTAERHRAIVRIEDVSPRSSPAALRDIADRLYKRGVPFSVAVIPIYEDPLGAENGGRPTRIAMRDAPQVTAALRYMLERGGSLVLHGYTHQYRDAKNPYNGTTAADFEFYRAHVDPSNRVVLDGPVDGDSGTWAADRVASGLDEIAQAGLPRPGAFEYPHYAGSPADSRAIARTLDVAFQREIFFSGALRGGGDDTSHSLGLTFPFVVKDVYGWRVVPENVGNYIPVGYNQQPVATAGELIDRARAIRVVRDGVAGFFFHPIFDRAVLDEIVDGIRAEGYSFVALDTLSSEAL